MIETKIETNYTGSITNYESVKKQIAERWSPEEAENYNPKTNCMPYKKWQENNFYVIQGESALHSTIIIEKKDRDGKVVSKYPKKIALFYRLQVRPVEQLLNNKQIQ